MSAPASFSSPAVHVAARSISADQTLSDMPKGMLRILALSKRAHEQHEEAQGYAHGWTKSVRKFNGELTNGAKLIPLKDYFSKIQSVPDPEDIPFPSLPSVPVYSTDVSPSRSSHSVPLPELRSDSPESMFPFL